MDKSPATKGYEPAQSSGRSPKSSPGTDQGDSRRKGPDWAKRGSDD